MKKIYFAGSIRGGRADADLYHRMIVYMQQELACKVLTEHVGDLSLSQKEGSTPSNLKTGENVDQAIYLQDTGWLKESDIVIAECTTPSLGVGYELAFAEKLNKPVHIFYNKRRTRLSAMIAGNSYFLIHPYTTEDEIFPILNSILP